MFTNKQQRNRVFSSALCLPFTSQGFMVLWSAPVGTVTQIEKHTLQHSC